MERGFPGHQSIAGISLVLPKRWSTLSMSQMSGPSPWKFIPMHREWVLKHHAPIEEIPVLSKSPSLCWHPPGWKGGFYFSTETSSRPPQFTRFLQSRQGQRSEPWLIGCSL